MAEPKSFFKRPIGIITGLLVAGLLVTMTVSDIYYSKLEKDYPLLTKAEPLEGTITHLKDHWDYTYLEIDSDTKRLIRPTENLDYSPSKFNEFVHSGDKIIHEEGSDKIELIRNGQSYYFELI